MTDLDTLRPEVREAVADCDREYWARIDGKPTPWSIIRAELVRLTAENSELRRNSTEAYKAFYIDGEVIDALKRKAERADHIEAKLAALKAKIAESAHVDVTLGCAIDGEIPPDLALCKVALVKVEE